MEWMKAIGEAVKYIENNMTEDITVDDVAKHVCISLYFHKGFSMLCGYPLKEYIRNRRLSLAGEELLSGGTTITRVAMKYGYDSPDSFTKAFTRFHGISPSEARKGKTMLKAFAPLKLIISLEGGYVMDYKISKKESFTVIASSKKFGYANATKEIPLFWQEHSISGRCKNVCGMFGINIDPDMGNESFEYLIADLYNPAKDIPEGFVTRTIPAFTWAVFPIRGAMPDALQDVK